MSLRRLLCAVGLALGLLVTSVPAPAIAGDSEYGRTWRKDGRFPGDNACQKYTFQYRVKPRNVLHPRSGWTFEAFLIDRNGNRIAHNAKDDSIDPKRGSGEFKICDASTVPGRFKIRGKLTVYPADDGVHVPGEPVVPPEEKWVKPGYFRLR